MLSLRLHATFLFQKAFVMEDTNQVGGADPSRTTGLWFSLFLFCLRYSDVLQT